MNLNRKLSVALSVLGLLLSLNSFAGISIEPLVGYNWITDFNVDNGKDYNTGYGIGYGGKLGFEKDKKQGLSGGFDYLRSDVNMANNDFDQNVNMEEWGVYLGLKLPVLFKFYGEWIFSATGDTDIGPVKENLSSGMGWKVGAGCTIIPFIDMNLDYRQLYFDNVDVHAFMFSLSLPIHLFE